MRHMNKESFILDFIEKPDKYYLDDDRRINIGSNPQIKLEDVVFYRIDRITYEEKAPRKEALENVLSAIRLGGVNFVYLIKGDKTGVSFYYGICRDLIDRMNLSYSMDDLGDMILKPSLESNFRGSIITKLNDGEEQELIDTLANMNYIGNIDGVPGINEDEENLQGVDRLVDAMLGDWLKYIDEVILKRIDYGKGKGMYISTIALFSMQQAEMQKLQNTVTSLFSGETGNRVPLRPIQLEKNGQRECVLRNFQIAKAYFTHEISTNEIYIRTALSQYVNNDRAFLGNWFSVNELSIVAGLPQKEVVGLSLREEVEFGLNYQNDIDEDNKLPLGNLVQNGKILDSIQVYLDKRELDKHIFIAGVTGAGKTTTCQKILLRSETPFLVIEPAKTEYRILTKRYDDILIFTLGKDKIAPFRLNPFEMYPHESVTSHVDMIMASIESAFDMEAAIPQIIEKSIYECYTDFGWDISDDTNKYYSWEDIENGAYAFPTLLDLINKAEKVVKIQGFDSRLQNDYIGSIRARLQGLTVGAKGLMLNTRRSLDFRDLVHKRVILELEEIRSGSEKALIMGFILSNLMEAIRAEYQKAKEDCIEFKHTTLVEEAHRLLGKYEPGDSLSKKQGIEMFSDMLAEVRKYGESLIIVDQIPGKLTPEVLKNTNTKIVHKIFAQDDKEAIGNTMALTDDQKRFLSFLDKGRTIVFSQGWESSLQVQITKETDTGSQEIINEDVIHDSVVNYYCQKYQSGIFPSLKYLGDIPQKKDFEKHFTYRTKLDSLIEIYQEHFVINAKAEESDKKLIIELESLLTIEQQARYIRDYIYYHDDDESKLNMICSILLNVKNDMFDLSMFSEKIVFGRRLIK